MSDYTLYERIPTTIEAVHWTGENTHEVTTFGGGKVSVDKRPLQLLAGAHGAQGWVEVPIGHWILRNPGDTSDMWPCDNDVFAETYRNKT